MNEGESLLPNNQSIYPISNQFTNYSSLQITNDNISEQKNNKLRSLTSLDIIDNNDEFDDTQNNTLYYLSKKFFSNYLPNFSIKFELALCIFVLMIATAIERVSFKMVIDRMVPYRVIIEIVILGFSCILYSFITFIKRIKKIPTLINSRSIPHLELLFIAFLDTIQFSGSVVTAAGVPPVMTIILLHASTPCIVIGSRYFFPDRKYSNVQNQGIILIFLSLFTGLLRPIIGWSIGRGHVFTIICSFVYVLSAAFQGIALLYKERAIIRWSYHLDIHYLSSWLFLYQFIIVIIFSPIIYLCQDISSDLIGYPLLSFMTDIYDGVNCLAGIAVYYPHGNAPYDNRYMKCNNYINIYLIISYVLSNICILYCISKLLSTRQEVLGRTMSFAVIIACFALGYYDTEFNYGYGFFGSNIGYTDIISALLLVAGMEIYGRDPEPDIEPISLYESSLHQNNSKNDNI